METFKNCKLEIFIPQSHLSALQKALQAVDAGHIGQYDSCMSYSPCDRLLAAVTGKYALYRQYGGAEYGTGDEGGSDLPG